MKKTPIVFLDFDGVLNDKDTKEMISWHTGIDPKHVTRLNEIMRATAAKVVISTSWRGYYTLDEIKEFLMAAGFKYVDDVIGATLSVNELHEQGFVKRRKKFSSSENERSSEIEHWVSLNIEEGQNFVILDDLRTELSANQVLTLESVGLTDDDVKKAISILLK